MIPFIEKLQDIFPDKFFIGGSYAYNHILGLPRNLSGDIDLFTDVNITRDAFCHIVRTMLFPLAVVKFEDGGADGHYGMKGIRKVIKVSFPSKEYAPVDFVFLHPGTDVGDWVLNSQASTLSQCYIPLSWRENYTCIGSGTFQEEVMERKIIQILPDTYATIDHLRKIIDFCTKNNFELKF